MADLSFSEDDGQLHLRLGPAVARVEGRGKLSFSSSHPGSATEISRQGRAATLRRLQRVAAGASILLLVLVVALTVWHWIAGGQVPAFVTVSADVASLALLGSVVSLGGVSLMSVEAIAAESQRIEAPKARCPFEAIKVGVEHGREPGHPDVCVKCPLGLDRIGDPERGFLLHNCSVYDELHKRWRQTDGGRRWLKLQDK